MPDDVVEFSCRDECGTKATVPAAEAHNGPPGWSIGQLTGRWRCPACTRKLDEVNGYAE